MQSFILLRNDWMDFARICLSIQQLHKHKKFDVAMTGFLKSPAQIRQLATIAVIEPYFLLFSLHLHNTNMECIKTA